MENFRYTPRGKPVITGLRDQNSITCDSLFVNPDWSFGTSDTHKKVFFGNDSKKTVFMVLYLKDFNRMAAETGTSTTPVSFDLRARWVRFRQAAKDSRTYRKIRCGFPRRKPLSGKSPANQEIFKTPPPAPKNIPVFRAFPSKVQLQ